MFLNRIASILMSIALAIGIAYSFYVMGSNSVNVVMLLCTASFLIMSIIMKSILSGLPWLLLYYLLLLISYLWPSVSISDDFLILATLVPAVWYDAEAFRKIAMGE